MKKKVLLKDIAYQKIKENIFKGHYNSESYISENMLVKELNMSRTPIREALHRLEDERLVKIISYQGIVIHDLTLKETIDLIDLRLAIEMFAFKNCVSRLTPQDLNKIAEIIKEQEQAYENQDIYACIKADIRFHTYFIERDGNELFAQIMQNATERLFRHGNNVFKRRPEHVQQSINDHYRILDLLKKDKLAEAIDDMEEHIKKGKTIFIV